MPRKAKKNIERGYYIRRAVSLTNTAISHNEKRLTYPDLFSTTTPTVQSPLHWNLQKFSKRDLVEFITALCEINAVVDSNGNPTSFATVVQTFESVFNISLGNAYHERERILMRKLKSGELFERMSCALRTKSSQK